MQVNINWNKFDSKKYRPLVEEEVPNFKPGTLAYDDYWDAQDDRCIRGFKPNRFMPKISGEHYFYLNMCRIQLLEKGASRKTLGAPFYRELDRRLFDEIRDAKKGKYGLIVGKPRRVGLSYVGSATSTYELLFYKKNEIGVAAGQDDKAQDFYEKVKDLLDNVIPEYRSGIITRNSELIELGYTSYENKQKRNKGLQSKMYMKTMYAKPTGFEGKSLSLVIFEEAGLFEDIIAAYKSTEPCFKEGSIQFGTPLVYGTGGDIEKGSKGYKTMWNNPKAYNLKKVFISATDYYPGDGVPDKKTGKAITFFDFRTGRTDSKAAYEYITRERLEKEGTEGYIKHIQSYPLKESDIFIKNSGGLLNRKKLNAQSRNQDNCPFERKQGRLEWVTKDSQTKKLVALAKNLKEIDKIHLARGSKLKFIEDEELGTIHKILDPIKQKSRLAYNPDIGGCDSYDEDNPGEHASLGGTIIYRCFYAMNQPHDLPVAYILDRGTADNDDEFYSQTFRLSVYYDIELLVEYTKISIINYFKDVGGVDYLKKRPDLTASGYNSKARNEYGFKMPNQHAWALTLRLLKQEVNFNFGNYWFIEILEHLIEYGESNSDLGSALGMVMVSKLDLFGEMSDGIDEDPQDGNVIEDMGFYAIENGQAVFKTYREANSEHDPNDPFAIRTNEKFNPEYDLEGEEREMYYQSQVSAKDEIQKRRKDILETYGNDIMAFTLNQLNNEIEEK